MQQHEVVEHLLKQPWEKTFDAGVINVAKGQEHAWRASRLRWASADKGGLVNADMQYRLGLSVYSPTVEIEIHQNNMKLKARCSCRSEGCEHAYLMLHALIKEKRKQDNFNPAPITQWLQKVKQASELSDSETQAKQHSLVLSVGTFGERRYPLAEDLIVAPMMRSDEATQQPLQAVQARHLNSNDQIALGQVCITAYEPVPRQTTAAFYVREAIQEQVLERFLAERRVYALGAKKPLTKGRTIKPTFEWQIGEHATQYLVAHGSDGLPLAAVGVGHSAWYIDAVKGVMGRLEGDMREWQALRTAPVIRREHVATAVAIWDQVKGSERVGRPVDVRNARRAGKAQPQLTGKLRKMRLDDGIVHPVPIANLTYACMGVQLTEADFNANGEATRLIGGQPVTIARDKTTLDNAHAALCVAGLQAKGDGLPFSLLSAGEFVLASAVTDLAAFWNSLTVAESNGVLIDRGDLASPRKLTEANQFGRLVQRDGSQWFDVQIGIEIDNENHSLEPILIALIDDPLFQLNREYDSPWAIMLPDGKVVTLPVELLKRIVGPLNDWLRRRKSDPRGDHGFNMVQAGVLAEELGKAVDGRTLKTLRGALRILSNQEAEPVPRSPKGLKATLRPYQSEGLRWLNALAKASMEAKNGFGGVLADDMGLGKTIQTIAHILWLREQGWLFAPVLIVVPKSLVGNWEAELKRFAPSLSVLVFGGTASERADRMLYMADANVVITTYNFMVNDADALREQPFSLIVTDEGQRAKNLRSKAATTLRSLSAFRVLDLSGTVFENNMLELFAHVDLAVPGLLGDAKSFTSTYRTPIEKHGDAERLKQLRRAIAPFTLRRTKAQVEQDLPPKTEMVQYVTLESEQAALYESVRVMVSRKVREAIKRRGIKQANVEILDALLKLRQVCCDPRLVKLPSAAKVTSSAKFDDLFDQLDTLVQEGRRILVFSAFTEMLMLISAEAESRGIKHLMLHGKTKNRDDVVREYQEGDAPLFLLTLKAGGVGLNLTAADTVIHYDPWWNPAAEAQASDRAHRIGQDKPVFVCKLIAKDTVEEKINALQARKAGLAEAIFGEEEKVVSALKFTEEDIVDLFGE